MYRRIYLVYKALALSFVLLRIWLDLGASLFGEQKELGLANLCKSLSFQFPRHES